MKIGQQRMQIQSLQNVRFAPPHKNRFALSNMGERASVIAIMNDKKHIQRIQDNVQDSSQTAYIPRQRNSQEFYIQQR